MVSCLFPLVLNIPWYVLGLGLMVRVVGLGSQGPEFKSCSAIELIPGRVDSACHPSEVSKMSTSLLEWLIFSSILCRSRYPSMIVPNSLGDCFGSTNALCRAWSECNGYHGIFHEEDTSYLRHPEKNTNFCSKKYTNQLLSGETTEMQYHRWTPLICPSFSLPVEPTSMFSSISFVPPGLQDSSSPPSQIIPNTKPWSFLHPC